ncbi:hypothetical protein [Zavarzinella formosa]|uniref:hypothetical protein n=1 Tax=Zavarzinella formosa TaxID=360055 RepID=UPI000379C04D|nr:hypothetical protein [Zavarzinella formosa]
MSFKKKRCQGTFAAFASVLAFPAPLIPAGFMPGGKVAGSTGLGSPFFTSPPQPFKMNVPNNNSQKYLFIDFYLKIPIFREGFLTDEEFS